MKKSKNLKCIHALALLNAIKTVSQIGKEGSPIMALPFRLAYPLGRTLKSLSEALEPIQKENERIYDGWAELQAEIADNIRAYPEKAKDWRKKRKAEFDKRNKEWESVLNTSIDVDVFTAPKLSEDETAKLEAAGLTPQLLADLDPLELLFYDDEGCEA